MEFLDSIVQVNKNWQPYQKWDLEQQKKEKQNSKLLQQTPPSKEEKEHAKQYGRTLVDVINTMDQYSIDKSEDAAMMIGTYAQAFEAGVLLTILPLNKLVKKIPMIKKMKSNTCAMLISVFIEEELARIVLHIIRAKYEKQASRIARYQTREQDLKDPRHFVVYSKEQIEEAKKIASQLGDVKDNAKKRIKGFNPNKDYKAAKKTMEILEKDHNKYMQWKKEYNNSENIQKEAFKNFKPTQEQINQAEKDRDSMLGTIKKIENNSLDYLNNMSMFTSLIFSGFGIGAFFVASGINSKLDKVLSKIKYFKGNEKAVAITKMINLAIFPTAATLLTFSSIVKFLKDSARVGRFKAKQDLLAHPENFIGHSNEDRKKVPIDDKDINKKGFLDKIKQDFDEIKNFKNDYQDWSKYMQTKHKEELKLDEALKQVKITDKQKADAIKLQREAFHSFEKVDEKAQRFTDDTDAAVDIISGTITGIISATFKIIGVLRSSKLIKNTENINNKSISKAMWPFLVPQIIHPFIKIIGTRFKKDAGKIGVMTAMQDMDDPKNFIDDKRINSKII